MFALADGETVTDKYHGIEMKWTYATSQHGEAGHESRFYLCLRQKHKHSVARYLRHIKSVADEVESRNRQLQVLCLPALIISHAYASVVCLLYTHQLTDT